MAKVTSAPIRLIRLGQTDSWKTQAYFHAVADLMEEDTPDTIILCSPATPYLCLGYHQIFENIFNKQECERIGIPVYRRKIGGGATYLDKNQLFYQFIFHNRRLPLNFMEVYAKMLEAPIATINRLGLEGKLRDINEVEANGRRIAGIGGGRIGQASVVVGNFLFDFDYEVMTQVWQAPWEPFRKLAGEALRDRVATLKELLDNAQMDAVENLLIEELRNTFKRPIESGEFTPQEDTAAKEWSVKMQSETYLNLHRDDHPNAPMQALKISAGVFIHAAEKEFDGHPLKFSFRVKDGLIEEAHIQSDPPGEWGEIESGLRGVKFEEWEQNMESLLGK